MRESWTIKGHGRRSALGPFVRRAGVTNNDAKCTRLKWTWMAGQDEINEPESVKILPRESCYAPIFNVALPLLDIKSTRPIFIFIPTSMRRCVSKSIPMFIVTLESNFFAQHFETDVFSSTGNANWESGRNDKKEKVGCCTTRN